ncbi:hypothetical protein ACFQQB_12180 [Nonomuraea rubra]|uniref:hypothetical protein n=1 Tax=Nonomuraea rubra TaxID=46180 RepID=UPI00361E3E37
MDVRIVRPLDAEGVLADHDCERAVQLAYSAKSGHVKILQIMASFPTEQDAKSTATRLLQGRRTDRAFTWKTSYIHGYYGRVLPVWSKSYLIVTVVSTDKTGKPDAMKFLAYLMSDRLRYFGQRDRIA